jgi:hypothetical protein
MPKMTLVLTDAQLSALSENASYAGLGSAYDFMMEFVNREEEKAVLRQKIVDGMNAPVVAEMNEEYFQSLRNKLKQGIRS